MHKGVPNKRYAPEFKEEVIKTMQEERLGYLVSYAISDRPALSMAMDMVDSAARRLLPGEQLPFCTLTRAGSISLSIT